MKLYAVVDRKAKHVVTVFQAVNNEGAERSFLMLLTSAQSSIFTDFPEDFELYPVAELSFSAGLSVTDQKCVDLNDKGFKANSFVVLEPVASGSDYDKRYLTVLRQDRSLSLGVNSVEKEVVSDVNG